MIDALHQVGSVDLCGDGGCDSPGHTAKYGTYTLLDENTGKIPAFTGVQVTEVTSSNAMEAEGCRRALDSVLANNFQVQCLTTDRHVTITSEMRKKYPRVKHQYGVASGKEDREEADTEGQEEEMSRLASLDTVHLQPISGGAYRRAMGIMMSLRKSVHQ